MISALCSVERKQRAGVAVVLGVATRPMSPGSTALALVDWLGTDAGEIDAAAVCALIVEADEGRQTRFGRQLLHILERAVEAPSELLEDGLVGQRQRQQLLELHPRLMSALPVLYAHSADHDECRLDELRAYAALSQLYVPLCNLDRRFARWATHIVYRTFVALDAAKLDDVSTAQHIAVRTIAWLGARGRAGGTDIAAPYLHGLARWSASRGEVEAAQALFDQAAQKQPALTEPDVRPYLAAFSQPVPLAALDALVATIRTRSCVYDLAIATRLVRAALVDRTSRQRGEAVRIVRLWIEMFVTHFATGQFKPGAMSLAAVFAELATLAARANETSLVAHIEALRFANPPSQAAPSPPPRASLLRDELMGAFGVH